MLEFKTLQELKPNTELLEIIKNYTYKVRNELTNHLVSVCVEEESRLNFLMENYKNNDEKLSEKNKEINQLE